MKLCILVVMVAAAAVLADAADIDVNGVLANRRKLVEYLKCMFNQGRCTPEAIRFRGIILEALQHGCYSCSETEKVNARKVVVHLVSHELRWWQKLVDKYDPQMYYASKYETSLI